MLYATLEELKKMRASRTPATEDLLGKALATASRAIDRKAGRRFWLDADASSRTYGVTGRTTPDGTLLVDDIGDDGVLTVKVGFGTSWASVNCQPGPDNAVALGQPITTLTNPSAHWSGRQVRVTARWGWPAVPEEIGMATLLLASRLYLRKDSPEGIAGSAEWGPVRLSRWDPDVEALVAPYVLLAVA